MLRKGTAWFVWLKRKEKKLPFSHGSGALPICGISVKCDPASFSLSLRKVPLPPWREFSRPTLGQDHRPHRRRQRTQPMHRKACHPLSIPWTWQTRRPRWIRVSRPCRAGFESKLLRWMQPSQRPSRVPACHQDSPLGLCALQAPASAKVRGSRAVSLAPIALHAAMETQATSQDSLNLLGHCRRQTRHRCESGLPLPRARLTDSPPCWMTSRAPQQVSRWMSCR